MKIQLGVQTGKAVQKSTKSQRLHSSVQLRMHRM